MNNNNLNNNFSSFKKSTGLLAKDFKDPHVSKEGAMWISFWDDLTEPFSRFKRMVKRHANIIFNRPEHTMGYLVNKNRPLFDFEAEYEKIKNRGPIENKLILNAFCDMCESINAFMHMGGIHHLTVENATLLLKDLNPENIPLAFYSSIGSRHNVLIDRFFSNPEIKKHLKLEEHLDEYLIKAQTLGVSYISICLIDEPSFTPYLENPKFHKKIVNDFLKQNNPLLMEKLLSKGIDLSYLASNDGLIHDLHVRYTDGLNDKHYSFDHPMVQMMNSYIVNKQLGASLKKKDTPLSKKKKI